MLTFLADENFNNDIVRGVRRQNPLVDIVRTQEVGLSQAEDPEVLAWAATANRVVLTHDVSTMTGMLMILGADQRVSSVDGRTGRHARIVPIGKADGNRNKDRQVASEKIAIAPSGTGGSGTPKQHIK